MKKILFFLSSLAAAFFVFHASGEPLKVGLLLDRGGKDDKSFNSSAYQGLLQAQKDFKIFQKTVEASDDNSFESFLRSFAQKKFDLIIAVGFAQGEALRKVAPLFPNQKFAIIDADVVLPNVKSLLFEEHEGSYLVGALAALKSKTGTISFIGGMDIPLIRRFELGYKEGAQKIHPSIKIKSGFVGVTSESWNNPPKGKELALSQFNSGADVIFACAGASNMGVFDAAEEKKLFAIGVDANQNWVKPGFILTSMMKRVDLAVYNSVKELHEGKFQAGAVRGGLNTEAVAYALDENNKGLLTAEQINKVEDLKKQIIAKTILVSDYYKIKKK